MPRITGGQVLSFLGFLVLVGVWTIIDRVFGQREAFRFWGLMLLVTSLAFTFMKRIPVTVGNTELKPLEGWRKAYVLIPTYAIGLAVTTFPHEVACAVHLKGYVCG
ncbi:hypothetical protein [Roseateles sp.]|mgnify:CR=1 FL=1|uniref:hypothetical protein n=1 Tax=Roseateles sp. TaxID=1971397 RepID=UPI003D0CD7CD